MVRKDQKRTKEVATQIKNPDLVEERRKQIVNAAIELFIKNGFHKTTTRQIAEASGFSIGSLYEYVASKEDILFLVCDNIHQRIEESLNEILSKKGWGKEALSDAIREYFIICDQMSANVLLVYQESKSLPPQWREKIIETESRIKDAFVKAISKSIPKKKLSKLDKRSVEIVGHNIAVLGHMWSFRRWSLVKNYSIDEYIKIQTEFILGTSSLLSK